jgi:hypothetical protein
MYPPVPLLYANNKRIMNKETKNKNAGENNFNYILY